MTQELLKSSEAKMKKTIESAQQSFAGIRTGKASPSLLDNIKVDNYGQMLTIKQVSAISVRDSQTLMVQVWDKGIIGNVEKAIRDSSLGLSPVLDGQAIRVSVPPLSEERRKEYVKLVKKYSEESKISLRNIRRDFIQAVDKSYKEKTIAEDVLHKSKKDADTMVHKYEKIVDDMIVKKEKEIMEV